MVRHRFFAHIGRGRTTPAERLYRARYLPGHGRWAVGENLGFGTGALTRPAAIHSAWMHSTPHRAAMLSRRFREVGYGIAPGIPFQSPRRDLHHRFRRHAVSRLRPVAGIADPA